MTATQRRCLISHVLDRAGDAGGDSDSFENRPGLV
jgi:hypothetical protein